MKKILLLIFVLFTSLQIQAQCDDLIASFSSDSLFCAGASFDFVSTSQFSDGSPATFMWTANSPNAIISSNATPTTSIEFTQQGTYEVTLTIEDNNSCSSVFTKEILVQNAVADFTTTETGQLCGPLDVSIENTQNNNATSYLWHIEETTILGNTNTYADDTSGAVLTHFFNNPAMSAVELIVESAYACYDTLRIDSFVHVSFPQPQFSIIPPFGCDSTVVTVTDNSTLVDEYQFDWGVDVIQDYNLGESHEMMYTYDYSDTLDGAQVVFLNLHAETDGCTRSFPQPFILNPDPVIHMDVSSVVECPNIELSFYDNSTHTILEASNFFWDFGDGQTSSVQNPVHAYSEPGIYTIYHSVTSPMSCFSDTTWSQQIEILGSPEASFAYSNTVLCFGASEIQFENTSVDVTDSLSLLWTFGDDTFTNSNPSYQYYETNLYPVELLVTDQNLCQDSITEFIGIEVIAEDMNVGFTHTEMICAGADFEFTRNTELLLGSETYYSWSSVSDSVIVNDSTESTGLASFIGEGSFPLTLTLWNDFGCWGEGTQMVEVKNAHADFAASKTEQLCGPLDVTIVNLQNENATNYQWNITENTLSGEVNNYTVQTDNDTLIYNFLNPALSDVELIVESAYACYDTLKIDTLVDVFFPIPKFSLNQIQGCDSVYLEITDESFLVDTFSFSFGNSDTVDYILGETNTSLYTYDYINGSENGQAFVITLNAETSSCPKSHQEYFLLNPEPLIVMDASEYKGCPPFSIEFSDSSLYANLDACTYFWDFDDGHTSTEQNPEHTYEESGIFNVQHSITTANGCLSDTVWEQEIEIYQLPEASFTYSNSVLCFGAAELEFQDTSIDYTDSLLLTWSIEDTVFTQADPAYQYYITDTYEVNLFVEDQHQCFDDTTIYIDVEVIAEDVTVQYSHQEMICAGVGAEFEFTPNPALYINDVETHFVWTTTSPAVQINTSTADISSVSFTEEGLFPLTMTISNETGCLEEVTQIIEVKNAHADFATAQLGQLCGPLVVNIENSQNENATNYQWNITENILLGGTINDTVHTQDSVLNYFFDHPALSDIELIVESAYACYDTLKIDTLVDVFFPLPKFVINPVDGCDSVVIDITDQSNFVDYFDFDFGNGINGEYLLNETNSMSYTFDYVNGTEQEQVFTLSMLAITNSCPTTFAKEFTLYPDPEIQIGVSASAGCPPFNTTFYDQSMFIDTLESTYFWDFGDGFTSTERNPNHTYQNTGFYTVSHSVVTPNGCYSDTVWETQIEVFEMPEASFTYLNPTLCFGSSHLQFYDTSYDPTNELNYLWSFVGVGESTDENPLQEFLATEVYEVNLQIQDQNLCIDDTTRYVEVVLLDTFVVQPVINYVSIEDDFVDVKWAYTPDFYFDNLSLYHQDYNTPWNLIHNTPNYLPGEFSHDILPINEQNEYHLIQQDSCMHYSDPSEMHSTMLLTPISTSYQTVTLNWTPYIGWDEVEFYQVFRSLEDGDFEYIGEVDGDLTTYQDSSLCNSVYSYYVVANDLNSSFKSKSNKAWIIPEFIDFSVPLLLKYTSVSQNDKIYTQWNTHYPSEMTYYKIDRWDDYFGWIENYAYAAEPPYVDGDVGVDHRKYVYKISYADVCGNEGPKGRIGTNILLEASQFTSHYELTWNEYDDWIGDVSEHIIQYFNSELNAFQNIATVSGTTFTYTDTDLDKAGIDTSYCYRVVAQSAESPDFRSISNVQCFVPQPKDYFPNAFSPNNDGLNEVYKFEGNFAKEMKVEVYDFWGNIVFTSDEVDFEWDGTNQNTGDICPQGSYVFRFEITGFENTFMKNEMNIYIVK